MQDITTLLNECYSAFSQTEEYRILKTYRTRDNRLTFDERFAINKSIERTYAPVFELLRANAPSLTESDLFFCALTFQHIETVAIAECLTVTKDAIRMRKLRLREKLPNKWFDLLFPEQKRNSSDSVTSQNSAEKTAPITLPTESTKNAKVMKEKMSFGKAIANCFSNYCNFNGRARRSEYWYWVLFQAIIRITIVVVLALIKTFIPDPSQLENAAPIKLTVLIILILILLLYLGTLLPYLAVSVRRLHDRDDAGWLIIMLLVLPDLLFQTASVLKENIVNLSTLSFNTGGDIDKTMGLVAFYYLVSTIIRIVMFCKSGTEGPNAYGPDPIRIISQSDRQ